MAEMRRVVDELVVGDGIVEGSKEMEGGTGKSRLELRTFLDGNFLIGLGSRPSLTKFGLLSTLCLQINFVLCHWQLPINPSSVPLPTLLEETRSVS